MSSESESVEVRIVNDGTGRRLPASEGESAETAKGIAQTRELLRRRLPDERKALVHHFSVGGHEGYLIVGLYDDGQPGEIFIRMAKDGSTIAGLMDSFGIAISMALQFGVPLRTLTDKFSHTRFEPSGWTAVKEIGYAKSLMDYIFRWLALKFLLPASSPPQPGAEGNQTIVPAPASLYGEGIEHSEADAPACRECGAIMSRNGSRYKCGNCGWTTESSLSGRK